MTACGGGGWLDDHPDIAELARRDPDRFVEAAWSQWAAVRTLSGSYTMRVARGIGRRTFDVSIAVIRPNWLIIDVLAPTGSIEASLVANPDEVGLLVTEERVIYRGPATAEAFQQALGFDLSVEDAVAVLIGYALDRTVGGVTASWDDDARRIRVDQGVRASSWLHPVSLVFDRTELHAAGAAAVEVEIEETRRVEVPPEAAGAAGSGERLELPPGVASEGVPVPTLLDLQLRDEGYGIRLTLLGGADLNRELPASYFEVADRPGFVTLPLSELARDGGLFRRGTDEEE